MLVSQFREVADDFVSDPCHVGLPPVDVPTRSLVSAAVGKVCVKNVYARIQLMHVPNDQDSEDLAIAYLRVGSVLETIGVGYRYSAVALSAQSPESDLLNSEARAKLQLAVLQNRI